MRHTARISVFSTAVVVAFLTTALTALAADSTHSTPTAQSSGFADWISDASDKPMNLSAPSSSDNWLGGTGNWSNSGDWSTGEPGTASDVFINTGNDDVTLDVNASINSLTLGGASGSSTLRDTGTVTLTIAGALTINQSGTLTFNNLAGVSVGGTAMNAGTVHLSHGGLEGGNITNSGLLTLDVANVNASGTLTNSGTITAADDVNGVGAATIVNSGTILIDSVGSSGDFTNQSGGVVSAKNLNVGGNLINQGSIQGFLERASAFSVTGELTNSGTFNVEYSSSLTAGSLNNLVGGEIYDVSGQTTVIGNSSNAGGITVSSMGAGSSSGSLSIEGNLTNSGSISVAAVQDGPASAGVSGNIVNSGLINVNGGGQFGADGNVTNSGMITTGEQSGQLGNNSLRASGTLTNQAGGVLALYSMGDRGTFGFVNNAGSVLIASGAILNVIGGSHASANAFPGFLNSGSLTIAQGGTFSSPLNFAQISGQTTVDGTLRINGNAIANFSGGAVYGNGGTIQGNVTSNASINLGDMPMTVGLLMFQGNYTQGSNGSLTFDIASASQYDQLNVSGHAQLNGLMAVNLLNGYIPQVGNMFDIMNFASQSGTFSTVLGLPINNQEHFVLQYNATNLTLEVVSGPGMQAASGHGSSSGSEPFITPITSDMSFASNTGSAPASSVPEPGSVLLFGSGIAGVVAFLRRTRLS